MATNQEIIKEQILEAYNNLSSKGSSSNIISANDFYFESGRKALKELRNDNDKTPLSNLYKYINSKRANKENWYDSLYGENTLTQDQIKYRNTCELINQFVAYCDINAKGTDVSGKSYYDNEKRCIAKVNMAPPTWIMNILKYLLKESKETQYKDLQVTNKVQRAINYFDNPTKIFPIVSEEHRKQISEYFLGDAKEECDTNLKSFFADAFKEQPKVKLPKKDENLTYFYTSIIYEMKDKWEDLDVSFYENNKNVILTGAPGTGKTYLAKKIAAKIIGRTTTDELKNHPQFGFVQFHPSYDYTDFVEGLRPVDKGNDQVGFVLKNGIFKDFCERAAKAWIETTNNSKDPKELQKYREKEAPKYVFVIDEINRGEISKIFGELFFSIDPGYRGTDGAVLTQYSNMRNNQQQGSTIEPNIFDKILKGEPLNQPGQQESDQSKDAQQVIPNGHFFIPKNVYIIGTMNDIDRSVESMDFAFRRRFAFREITAAESKENILYYSDLGLDLDTLGLLSNAMDAINKKLTQLGFNDSYHIGGAYFQKISKYDTPSKYYTSKKTKMWSSLWEYHLKGTLYEYFRGEPDAEKKMTDIKNVYERVVNSSK